MSINKVFKWHYAGFDMMCRSRQKSAKKRRVKKKWLKRFGRPLSLMATDSNTFVKTLPKDTWWHGSSYPIPESLIEKTLQSATSK